MTILRFAVDKLSSINTNARRAMIREMNKDIFRENLRNTLEEINHKKGLCPAKCRFSINSVIEQGKSMQAKDEMMRLNILNRNRVFGRLFTIDEVVLMLSFFAPLVPIWIDVKLLSFANNEAEYQLDCSLRLRKPSLLRNQDSGHPPFRAIY